MRFAQFKDYEGNVIEVNMDKVLYIRHTAADEIFHFVFSKKEYLTIRCTLADLVVEITRP